MVGSMKDADVSMPSSLKKLEVLSSRGFRKDCCCWSGRANAPKSMAGSKAKPAP